MGIWSNIKNALDNFDSWYMEWWDSLTNDEKAFQYIESQRMWNQ